MIAGYSCSLAKSVGLNVNVFASSQDQHPEVEEPPSEGIENFVFFKPISSSQVEDLHFPSGNRHH